MRSLLVVVAALCGSTIVASGEEAYQRTGTVLGACLGQQMRDVGGSRMSADAMDSYLKQKCGQLEEQEQNEFLDFFHGQLVCDQGSKRCTLPVETVAVIMARIIAPPKDLRRVVVQAYKDVILKGKLK